MITNPEVHIGCSGYYYSSWKNGFYPKGVPASRWLQYYSSVFDTVELNGTFYRKPQLSTLKRYAQITPTGFGFAVKMSRYITHVLKLQKCKDAVKEFQDLIYEGLEEKLSAFLFQLPATFRYGAENLEFVLTGIPPGRHNIVEFRHESWWNEDVQDQLMKHDITFCNVDYPGLKSYFIATTDLFYLRMHGNPELFKTRYEVEELKKAARKIPADARQYFIYFNNTYHDGAYSNAVELNEILEKKKRRKTHA
jgi:uncharacterized protein YecE (DUF72 family)